LRVTGWFDASVQAIAPKANIIAPKVNISQPTRLDKHIERIAFNFVPLALANMSRFDPPKADNALLAFLVGVLSLVLSFALCMYWLMQPTVVANAGAVAFESEKSVAVILPSRSTILEIEQSEVAAALLENESQGLESVAVANHEPQTDPKRKLAKAPPRTPKSKRVVRVQRPPIGPFAHDAWAFAPNRARSFGAFGSWFR
jgi:hypothetical protein